MSAVVFAVKFVIVVSVVGSAGWLCYSFGRRNGERKGMRQGRLVIGDRVQRLRVDAQSGDAAQRTIALVELPGAEAAYRLLLRLPLL